ncbi:phosphatidylcholine-sterol acyltransferase [Chloropicon primus]|uniref:Phosphatidylcholine-sterol acyltransferase n=1 Tax=Chloropicon primus TaxID=1764295 RepID=A0A5B8MPA5_9CHLO|nr:phosphatidylcholine-sterol acyltransferase [Chloropicon primus]|eukprot:QDZ22313.1 phosphatidylcholine-sterol acyltransferase [Chloropicon primus]
MRGLLVKTTAVPILVLLLTLSSSVRGGKLQMRRDLEVGRVARSGSKRPIIIVPGLAASKVEARVDDEYEFPAGCEGTAAPDEWHLTWMDLSSIRKVDCFAHKLGLVYEEAGETSQGGFGRLRGVLTRVFGGKGSEKGTKVANRKGVEVRPKEFGGLGGITNMLSAFGTTFAVDKMTSFVRGLQRHGWVEGETLFGAPFDWRYAPTASSKVREDFNRDLTALVEECFRKTGLPVVLVSHSLGGLMTTKFLLSKPGWWKQRFVATFIPMSVPWAGAQRSTQAILIGDNGNVPFLPMNYFGGLQRTCTSGLWLLPRKAFWDADYVMVETPEKNYTGSMMGELLEDSGLPGQASIYRKEIQQLDGWTNMRKGELGVNMLCLISTNVRTMSRLVTPSLLDLTRDPLTAPYTLEYSMDGDGIVNSRSMRVCENFADEVLEFEGVGHRGILSSKEVIRTVANAATVQ